MTNDPNRRRLLKLVGLTLAATPVLYLSRNAEAKTNPAGRARYKYQEYPNGNWSCSNCMEFRPDTSNPSRGTCNKIPLDDEILADGYCIAWSTM
ncbi:MAG: high-potential iron-sulfur protein [Georgfuchsia sp.]